MIDPKKEAAELLLKEWNDLYNDESCATSTDTYTWCDVHCIMMNMISGVINELGYYIGSDDKTLIPASELNKHKKCQ